MLMSGQNFSPESKTCQKPDARKMKARPNNKISMLQGCVRQTSLQELAQQILAKEKISNSPRGRFSKQQLIHMEGFSKETTNSLHS
jgi:hypothetical protein